MCCYVLQEAAGFVFVPTETEKREKVFRLSYNVTTDSYTRGSDGEVIRGWEKAVWRRETVFRKEETDWKKVIFLSSFLLFFIHSLLPSFPFLSLSP